MCGGGIMKCRQWQANNPKEKLPNQGRQASKRALEATPILVPTESRRASNLLVRWFERIDPNARGQSISNRRVGAWVSLEIPSQEDRIVGDKLGRKGKGTRKVLNVRAKVFSSEEAPEMP